MFLSPYSETYLSAPKLQTVAPHNLRLVPFCANTTPASQRTNTHKALRMMHIIRAKNNKVITAVLTPGFSAHPDSLLQDETPVWCHFSRLPKSCGQTFCLPDLTSPDSYSRDCHHPEAPPHPIPSGQDMSIQHGTQEFKTWFIFST